LIASSANKQSFLLEITKEFGFQIRTSPALEIDASCCERCSCEDLVDHWVSHHRVGDGD